MGWVSSCLYSFKLLPMDWETCIIPGKKQKTKYIRKRKKDFTGIRRQETKWKTIRGNCGCSLTEMETNEVFTSREVS